MSSLQRQMQDTFVHESISARPTGICRPRRICRGAPGTRRNCRWRGVRPECKVRRARQGPTEARGRGVRTPLQEMQLDWARALQEMRRQRARKVLKQRLQGRLGCSEDDNRIVGQENGQLVKRNPLEQRNAFAQRLAQHRPKGNENQRVSVSCMRRGEATCLPRLRRPPRASLL